MRRHGQFTVYFLVTVVMVPVGINALSDVVPRVWGIALLLVAVPSLAAAEIRRRRQDASPGSADVVDTAADDLAAKVLDEEQDQRRLLLSGDVKAAAVRFEKDEELSGYRSAGGGPSGDVNSLLEYFQGLEPRRLVILGGPGAGKTVLAVELLVRLLELRAATGRGPVPLRVSLAGWDSARPLADQLSEHLANAYRVHPVTARELVRRQHILPVLDGLDEMDPEEGFPEPARTALESLNAHVHSTGFAPVVLTCRDRCHERLQEAGASLVDATTVRLQDLNAAQISRYLRDRLHSRAEDTAWSPVLDELSRAPEGHLTGVLSTPWRLALATTVYQAGGRPADLLNHSSPEEADAHLLARFVPSLTRLHPRGDGRHGPRHYDPERVTAWLARIARHLDQRSRSGLPGTDIVLHQLWPAAGALRIRCLHAAVVVAGVLALSDFAIGLTEGTVVAYVSGILALTAGAALARPPSPKRVDLRQVLTWRGARQVGSGLVLGLHLALGMGTVFSFVYALTAKELGEDFLRLLPLGIGLGLLFGPAMGLALRLDVGVSAALTPRDPLRNDLRFGITSAMVFWLAYGVLYWPVYTAVNWLTSALGLASVHSFFFSTPLDVQYQEYGPTWGFSSGAVADLAPQADTFLVLGCVCGLLEGYSAGSPWERPPGPGTPWPQRS